MSSTACLACASLCTSRARSTTFVLGPCCGNADLELRRHLIGHRVHDRGHASHHDYITDPEARRPRHLVENEVSALGDAGQAQARLVHLGAGRLHPFVQDGERARIGVDRNTKRLRHAVGGDVTVGRPDTAGGEDIGVAMPERIECIDDRSLLIADHSHFLEIDADRGQILRDIADVLVLGAAGQDLTTNHQERGRDNLFGSGRVDGWHDHLRVSAELLEFDRLINNWHRRFFWPLHSSRSLPSRAPEVAPWPDASAAVRMVVRRISLAQACLPAQAPARAQCFGRRMIG